MLRLSMPLISVHDLPAAIRSRSRSSSSGVQRILGIPFGRGALYYVLSNYFGEVKYKNEILPGEQRLSATMTYRSGPYSLGSAVM
jgi:hypothetical protein